MKLKSESIITIAILVIIVISFIIDIDKYVPGTTEVFPFVGIFLMVFDIYKSNKYLKNKPKDEIRIRSKNDSFYGLLPYVIGAIFSLVSIVLFFSDNRKTMAICIFISGVILVFKGILFIPNVLIKKENDDLHLENSREIKILKIKSLEKILINKDNIEFHLIKEGKFIFSNLKLNLTDIEIIRTFLRENTNTNVI